MLTTKAHEELSESYPAIAGSIPPARLAVTQFATRSGIAGETLEAVRLAVTEAVTNAVRHAYPDRTGAFHVTAAVTGNVLWVLVADDGCGHQTPSQRPGLGWGLTLIANVSEEYVITQRATGGTEVRMRFPIRPAANPRTASCAGRALRPPTRPHPPSRPADTPGGARRRPRRRESRARPRQQNAAHWREPAHIRPASTGRAGRSPAERIRSGTEPDDLLHPATALARFPRWPPERETRSGQSACSRHRPCRADYPTPKPTLAATPPPERSARVTRAGPTPGNRDGAESASTPCPTRAACPKARVDPPRRRDSCIQSFASSLAWNRIPSTSRSPSIRIAIARWQALRCTLPPSSE